MKFWYIWIVILQMYKPINHMNSRISLVLKAKNITPAQLADELGVQRSGISHILNGRNKPSLDFIQKLLKRYPDISMSWLMFGDGPMMNPYPVKDTLTKERAVTTTQPSLIDLFNEPEPLEDDNPNPEEVNSLEKEGLYIENEEIKPLLKAMTEITQKNSNSNSATDTKEKEVFHNEIPQSKDRNNPVIAKIVIFYNDRTFVEYVPGEL